jgi:hypothetical protein
MGEADKGTLRLDFLSLGRSSPGLPRGTPSDTGAAASAMRGSGGAVNVNDIPVAGPVVWAFSPRPSSVRTHAVVTGIWRYRGGVDARDESGEEALATKLP